MRAAEVWEREAWQEASTGTTEQAQEVKFDLFPLDLTD